MSTEKKWNEPDYMTAQCIRAQPKMPPGYAIGWSMRQGNPGDADSYWFTVDALGSTKFFSASDAVVAAYAHAAKAEAPVKETSVTSVIDSARDLLVVVEGDPNATDEMLAATAQLRCTLAKYDEEGDARIRELEAKLARAEAIITARPETHGVIEVESGYIIPAVPLEAVKRFAALRARAEVAERKLAAIQEALGVIEAVRDALGVIAEDMAEAERGLVAAKGELALLHTHAISKSDRE